MEIEKSREREEMIAEYRGAVRVEDRVKMESSSLEKNRDNEYPALMDSVRSPSVRASADAIRYYKETSPSPIAHTAGRGGLSAERSLVAHDESRMLEISRSLEGCTFSQLIHMAAKGAMMDMDNGTGSGTGFGSVRAPHSAPHTHASSHHAASSSSFPSTFDSPIRSTYQSHSRDVLYKSSASPNMSARSMSHISHSPGPFLSSFDIASSPHAPDYAAMQQLCNLPFQGTTQHHNGIDVRAHQKFNRGDLDLDSNNHSGLRRTSIDPHSAMRRGSSAGRRGGISDSASTDIRDFDLPHLSTSPLVTPYQSITHKGNAHATANYKPAQGVSVGVGDGYKGSGRRPHTAPHTASPSDASREELLDRLISLTKEAKVKSPLGPSFEDFEPL